MGEFACRFGKKTPWFTALEAKRRINKTRKGENKMSQPILVTGAAGGTQGSTGRHVAELLIGPADAGTIL
jgi:hypothetical protein